MLDQSAGDTPVSNEDHAGVIVPPEVGEFSRAATLMAEHIKHVENALDLTTELGHPAEPREI